MHSYYDKPTVVQVAESHQAAIQHVEEVPFDAEFCSCYVLVPSKRNCGVLNAFELAEENGCM